MIERDPYPSPTLLGRETRGRWDLWQQLDLPRGSTGKNVWDKAFKPDKLNDYRIVVGDVQGKMRRCLCQLDHLLDRLHLQRAGSTGKQDLNKTFKSDTINGCKIVEVHFDTKTLG
jgi:hypothetical protein